MSSPHKTHGADSQFHYWAFISYNQHDATHARRLHKELETFRVPRGLVGRRAGDRTIPRRLIPIFRDRDELPSAGDLTGKVREALEASNALIVICSPYAAASPWVNEEIRTFKMLGRGERIFPFIVDGEPYASDHPALGLPECFPSTLRFAVAADGTLTDRRSDPLAADAREGKDGRSNARLKLIAGLLGIGFDDLRRRQLARKRQRRRIGVLACLMACVAMAMIYVSLADSDNNVPKSAEIRITLDHYGLSIFRPIASRDDVVRTASAAREQLRKRLMDAKREEPVTHESDVWTWGQIAAAIYRDPDASNDDIRWLTPVLDQIFQTDFLLMSNGKPIGWSMADSRRVEASLWMIVALSHALRRKDQEIEAARMKFVGYLETVQQIAENYYPLNDGGWSVAIEDKPKAHNPYTSALALHALLESESAALCWRGDCERLTTMIQDTAQRFVRTFVDQKGLGGWQDTLSDDTAPDPDVSLMVYGALVRGRLPIPDNIRIAALNQLSDLRFRPYLPAHHEIRHWAAMINDRPFQTRVFWYPWAIEALRHWLRYADQQTLAPEIRRALQRSLGHLFSFPEEITKDMAHAAPYAVAETYYGIGGVR
jgi:TIR domain-containing protein